MTASSDQGRHPQDAAGQSWIFDILWGMMIKSRGLILEEKKWWFAGSWNCVKQMNEFGGFEEFGGFRSFCQPQHLGQEVEFSLLWFPSLSGE